MKMGSKYGCNAQLCAQGSHLTVARVQHVVPSFDLLCGHSCMQSKYLNPITMSPVQILTLKIN